MERVNALQIIHNILAAHIDKVGFFQTPQSTHSLFNEVTYKLVNAREDAGLWGHL